MEENKSYRVSFTADPRDTFQVIYTHKLDVVTHIIETFRFVRVESIIFNDYAES